MKRYLLPAMLVAGAVLSITGCQSNSTTSSSASTPSAAATGNPSSAVTLQESGSSLLYPFLQELVQPLKQQYPNITLNPAAGGSGKGISDAINGTVQLGGSDAYLSPGQLQQNQGLMNIPVAISAQAVNYNLPGVTGLKLSGDVLAQIYQGKITKWNDAAIAAINPGVKLPATTIVPVRRVDSSGDTFLFTSYLSATNPSWQSGPGMGTTVTWPAAAGEVTASGNPGMVQTCQSTPGCIAYIGISAEKSAQNAKLGEAQLQNKDGKFVQLGPDTINAAVRAGATNIPANLAQPLINEPGATSYPIVNYEYLVVKQQQSSSDTAEAIRTFLSWTMSTTGGNQASYLDKQGFVPLPAAVRQAAMSSVATLAG
ncbi:MAG TPA: phosphate ABC transporter substrate-binding protein PstS [Kribbella sp.]|nr:phosphate ABC transporter substrate-binding protein PstS [Kribbella sp.]